MTEPDIPEEWLMLLKLVKWTKNGSKTGFFLNLLKRLVQNFY